MIRLLSLFLIYLTLSGVDFIELEKSLDKKIYLFYQNYPKVVFSKQKFEIKLKLIITTDNFDKIETIFDNYKNIEIINPKQEWKWKTGNVYINNFYFKVLDKDFKLPDIRVILYKNNKIIDTRAILSKNILFREILSNDNYCNVIAKDLKVISQRTKQYSNKQILTLLEIEANYSNLEDFYINKYFNQSVADIVDNYPKQKIYYSVILPIFTKHIVFSYFNIDKKDFINIEVPIELKEDLVSTQTDINPNNNEFLGFKRILLISLILLFLIIFIFRRKIGWLIFVLIFAIMLAYTYKSNKAILKKGSKIYILPTKNSTIFNITDTKKEVIILNYTKNYYKIKLNQTIGWVKRDAIEN